MGMSEKRSLMIAGAGAATFLALAGQVAATAMRAPSPLETVLFGSLEIVFVSAAVYWLAQQAAERSFRESRREAGFGALRRIREAGETLERLESIVRGKKELIARHGKLDQALTLEYLDHILSVAGELRGKVLASETLAAHFGGLETPAVAAGAVRPAVPAAASAGRARNGHAEPRAKAPGRAPAKSEANGVPRKTASLV